MAPKNAPPAAKQAKILAWFQETMGVYTLKDLEKMLPSIGSINQMQVKEYLQALQDEGLIRCEKIGSGNWYWCFVSDAKKGKENVIQGLKTEERRLLEGISEAERAVREEMERQREDGDVVDRQALVSEQEGLVREMEDLDRELALYCDNDPKEVMKKVEETCTLRESAVAWTDNLESIYGLIAEMSDRNHAAAFMQLACGDEYVIGEGLKDLLGP